MATHELNIHSSTRTTPTCAHRQYIWKSIRRGAHHAPLLNHVVVTFVHLSMGSGRSTSSLSHLTIRLNQIATRTFTAKPHAHSVALSIIKIIKSLSKQTHLSFLSRRLLKQKSLFASSWVANPRRRKTWARSRHNGSRRTAMPRVRP